KAVVKARQFISKAFGVKTPIDAKASALHRLTIFLIWRADHLKYEQGQIDSVTGQPGHYRVNFEKSNGKWLVQEFDECIIRHGPDPAIASLLSERDCNEMRARWSFGVADPTIDPLWRLLPEVRPGARRLHRAPSKRIAAERLLESAVDV